MHCAVPLRGFLPAAVAGAGGWSCRAGLGWSPAGGAG